MMRPMNHQLLNQRQVVVNILRHTYATVVTTDAEIKEENSGGFGFTAEDLAKAKPFTEIPSPKIYPFVGNLFSFKPFGNLDVFDRFQCCTELEKQHGNLVRLSIPILPIMENCLEVMDPDDFEIVYRNEGRFPSRSVDPVLLKYRKERNHSLGLFLANDDEWWKFRQPLNPGMMKVNAAKPYLEMQEPIGNELVENLKKTLSQSENNTHTGLMDDFFRYALESVCAIVFDRRLGCMDPNLTPDSWQHKFIHSVHTAFEGMLSLNINPIYKFYDKVGYKATKQRKFEESMDYITDKSLELVQQSKEDWAGVPEEELRKKFLPQLLNIEKISIKDKLSVIFDMLLAAIDTTTYTTINNMFFLAKNPDVQEKLHAEVDQHIGQGSPKYSTFGKMPYLRACIKESHRMKPIAPIINRELLQDIVIKGYRIPKGTMVFLEHQYVSNISKYIEDPEVFNPDRWIRNKKNDDGKKLHPFLVLPFGFGPRMCIGKRFAEQELNIALAKMVQNFRIEYAGDKLPLKGVGLDKVPVKLNFRLHAR